MRWGPVERDLRSAGGLLIAGVDEVGRGPLAGPVVACAIIMRHDAPTINGVDDSKALTAPQRVALAAEIRRRALCYALGAASVREIDRLNIYHATTLAIGRALRGSAWRRNTCSSMAIRSPHSESRTGPSSVATRRATPSRARPFSPR